MTSIAHSSVNIQTTEHSVPAAPTWLGEVTLMSHYLHKQGVLDALCEQVHFARRRFGDYEFLDFFAVLLGYALSGERTLEEFYEHVHPFATVFMALFGRAKMPARSTLSRYLFALSSEAVEALRSLFLKDLLARPLAQEEQQTGLWDREGERWLVFDIDGTREAARQRALPKDPQLPLPQRRLDEVCAPGYTGRKRGEIVRTRTTILQAHTHQWLGSFGNKGNGQYREELRRAVGSIQGYLQTHQFPVAHTLLRLDGLYGSAAVVADLAGLPYVMRGKDYEVLEQVQIQARLHLCSDQQLEHPESGITRTLYDCPEIAVGSAGHRCRVIVATHPVPEKKSRVGVRRGDLIYELFLTTLPQSAFTAADVVSLYLHRGAFEPTLADEDSELDPDRWCSHCPAGQETWQIIAQWTWNLRLELGHQLDPAPARTTEFASAQPSVGSQPLPGYGKVREAQSWKAGRFSGKDFVLQPDGTLRCPAGQALLAHEHRREADSSLRIVYGASIHSCRPCPLREQCQWNGRATKKPRQVSVLLHPLALGPAPLLWRDWPRRQHRRACIRLLRHQHLEVQVAAETPLLPAESSLPLSRAERAHWRLSWAQRLARNARPPTAAQVSIQLFGVPAHFARLHGLPTT